MRRNYLTKSISIILMLLAMLFSCDQPTDVGSNNSNQQTSENQSQGNQNGENTGTEDNKDDVVTTGKIVGKATYTNTANHAGIQVTLVSTDGIVAYDSQISSRSRSAVAVMKNVVTSESGEYSFDNVKEGVYTIYASSDDSTEKAVLTNVVVQSNQVVTAADLNLTATGSICGRVTLDSKEDENLGITVVIAGTSYMAVTDSFGFFIISDIPADKGYQVVIMKGDYCTIWSKVSVEAGKENKLGDKNITSQSSDDKNYSFIWQGSSATPPANPEKYWAYFNTTDGCSYIYDGEKWTLLAQAGADGENGNGGGTSAEHKIIYELNGGTNSPYNPNLFLEYLTVNLNSPTRDGWYFDGWYENADFSGNRIKGWEIGEKRNDVTLYAKWIVLTANAINCIVGSVTSWDHTPMTDNKYTFIAAGGDQIVFTIGNWNYVFTDAVVDALDTEVELKEYFDGAPALVTFADGVLTAGTEYTATLIVKGDHEAYVKVSAK